MVVGWYALVGQKLPDPVHQRLTKALAQAVSSDSAFRQAMTDGGFTINAGDSRALQERIDKECAWADVIRSANIQAN